MPLLETPPWWFGSGPVYLQFISAVGWLMCGVLALAFMPSHEATAAGPRRIAVWPAMAAGFASLCVAAMLTMLDLSGSFASRLPGAARWSLPITGGGVLCLLSAATPPHHLLRRAWLISLALTAGSIPVVLWFFFAIESDAAAAAIYGALGAWLLTAEPADDPLRREIPPRPVSRILGGTLVTIGLAGGVSVLAPDSAPGATVRALVFATGAAAACCALWRVYVSERTLPRVRERRVVLGLRPLRLLPALLVLVLGLGFVAMRSSVFLAESFAAHRLLEELRAVITTLDIETPPTTSGGSRAAAANAGSRPALEELGHLLSASPAYRAAALWTLRDGTASLLSPMVRKDSLPSAAIPDLLPRPGAERRATLAGHVYVRWAPPVTRHGFLVVMVPLAIPGEETTCFLSVAVEAQSLGDMIEAHQLQALVIVGLLALIAGIAVLTAVRSFNEIELRVLKEQAESESQTRNELFAMVSHEVRTPLQSVLGYAELTAAETLPPAARRHVRAILTQGAALLRIVQDILDLSAPRSGRLQLQPEPVALRQLADGVRHTFADRAQRKGLTLSVIVDDAVPAVVLVDRVRLDQVLLNLVSNAIKFTTHGRVGLTISAPDSAANPAEVRLEFRVEDTGPGIPPVQLRRIFEPFRKLRNDDAPRGGGGVGLGLAICQQIVDSLRGRISVESTEGNGTIFRVQLDLPIASPSALIDSPTSQQEAAPSMPDATTLAGLRVLLIEDHPLVRELLRDFLQRLGAAVCARADGASGLVTAQETPFDIILLDVILPDIGVDAMLTALRRHAQSAFEPWIIGLSAGATEHEIQHALEHGMNDFLLKPVSLAGLAETLRLSPAGARVKDSQPSTPGALPSPTIEPRAPTAEERAALQAETGPAFARIAQACAAGASDTVAAEAHFLANSFLLLAQPIAHRLCLQIEDAAEIEDLVAARTALAELGIECVPPR